MNLTWSSNDSEAKPASESAVNVTATKPGPIGSDRDADDVLEAIHVVMHLARSQRYRAQRDGADDLTHMDDKVLGFFARHPGATQSELAVHAGRDKGQLARLIAGLKERGLLEARADEADRRSVRLTLTDAGQSAHRILQRRRQRLSQVAVAGLSDAERRQLLALLARVRDNLSGGQPG